MRWFRKLNASYLCCNLIKRAVHKVVYMSDLMPLPSHSENGGKG
jgi:hypothetical protein